MPVRPSFFRHCPQLLLLGLLLCPPLASAQGKPLPDGYRLQNYRAPTPDNLPGATVLDSALQVQQVLAAQQPLLLDVMAAGLVTDADGQRHWLPGKARRNLPGSVWLPNVGYGELEPEVDAYFRRQLARLSGGDPARPLLFYCLRDCWMSWNAARRALSWGYHRVYWYPAGSDGWQEAGLPLTDGVPQAW